MHGASRTAGCPSAERNVLTQPTGEASSRFALARVESPFAQPRHPGRADALKRRRKERDDFLGREGRPSQSPSRKGRRQTLYSCLVRPARGVDARFWKDSLAPVSRASSKTSRKKNWIIQSRSGVRPLDFRDHIAVRRHCALGAGVQHGWLSPTQRTERIRIPERARQSPRTVALPRPAGPAR
jgi:hypothetical protein